MQLQPDTLYTIIILSLSIGFFINSIIFGLFMEDRARYLTPLFALLSILITVLIERPILTVSSEQLIFIPLGSAVVTGLLFFVIHMYTKAKTP